MNLFNDLKPIIQQDLTTLGIQFGTNDSVEDALVLRYTHMRKTIRSVPQTTHQSNEFTTALAGLSPAQKNAMADILAKFQRGDDVNGHLSRASANPSQVDGMLYDWDIYHLHVSNTKEDPAQKFFDRAGPVALVKVARTDAYFIDIRSHGAGNHLLWTQKDILEIIDRNWPALLDPFTLKGATAVAYDPSPAELQLLRGNSRTGQGAMVPIITVGNRVIMPPGGGMASSGTSNAVMDAVRRTQRTLKEIERFLLAHGDSIKAEVGTKMNVPVASQDFSLVRQNGCWAIALSGHVLEINALNPALAELPAAAECGIV